MTWLLILLIAILVLVVIVSVMSLIMKSLKIFIYSSAVIVSGVVIIWAFLRLIGVNVLNI